MYLDFFAIGNTTGKVTLLKSLDRETKRRHVFTVKALDNGSPSKTNSTNITINVLDVNDNSPKITPTVMDVELPEVRNENTLFH